MGGVDAWLWLLGRATHEITLFAAVGLLVGGIDDLLIDLIWIARSAWRWATVYRRHAAADAGTLRPATAPGRIAVFVGAWDEAPVIGAMLRTTLERFGDADYRIFVGLYPNDPATMNIVRRVQGDDPRGDRLHLVVGTVNGPTTKAENLNRLWEALQREEQASGIRVKAVVLHDAEDVVHPAELRVFDRLIERFDLVQLPVLPLVTPGSPWVSAHYCDEFADAHGKQLVVREALGAAMPLAGTGCAMARDLLQRVSDANGGGPFDAASLTEDYELGLRLRDYGGRAAFVRLPAAGRTSLVAVRAYFPATLTEAVRQKTRWMTGIALSGWDRLGWRGGIAERWMRLRDRRAVLAALIVAAAYAALLLWAATAVSYFAMGRDFPATSPLLIRLCELNVLLLMWRIAMRMLMVRRVYGWREALRSPFRMIIGNIIGMVAAWRAVLRYAGLRRGGAIAWDKTRHSFPGSPWG